MTNYSLYNVNNEDLNEKILNLKIKYNVHYCVFQLQINCTCDQTKICLYLTINNDTALGIR